MLVNDLYITWFFLIDSVRSSLTFRQNIEYRFTLNFLRDMIIAYSGSSQFATEITIFSKDLLRSWRLQVNYIPAKAFLQIFRPQL